VERLKQISNNTLLGATGEISDFQALTQLLDRLMYSIDSYNSAVNSTYVVRRQVVESKIIKLELNLGQC
jgi:20S proteasome alpha/beta subunit